MDKMKDRIVLFHNPSECCGCGACADICPKNAISMRSDESGILPIINDDLCVRCGKCLSACGLKKPLYATGFEKKAFIGMGNDHNLTQKSASGGVFASIAEQILSEGGVVYGAALDFPQGMITCRHIRVDKIGDLHLIQNSKYVQSDTTGVFKQVRTDLENGIQVLFSGTSCQVASLLAFLGIKHYDNLTTVDLICHGVPPIDILRDYVKYLEAAKHGKVTAFSFRRKEHSISKHIPYVLSVGAEDKMGMPVHYYLPLRETAYYRLFMTCAGYRESCYSCKFASTDKPADLTLGDYYIHESRSEAVRAFGADSSDFFSCVIVHSESGQKLIEKSNLCLNEVPLEDAVADHEQLRHASVPSAAGLRMLAIYRKRGFKGLQSYIDRKNKFIDTIRAVTKRKR